MISFTILNEENISDIEERFTADYPDADGEYLRDILYSLAEDDCEVAVSQSHGCLLVRLYDEGYSFVTCRSFLVASSTSPTQNV